MTSTHESIRCAATKSSSFRSTFFFRVEILLANLGTPELPRPLPFKVVFGTEEILAW